MIDLHLKYLKEHLEYSKWLAYYDEIHRQEIKRQSWSADTTWNELSENQRKYWLEKAEIGFFLYLMFKIDGYRQQFAIKWKCPICDAILDSAPEDHKICGTCMTHFDNDDSCYTVDEMKERHSELRKEYLNKSE